MQRQFLAAFEYQFRRPLTVLPVEKQNCTALFHTQHIDQIIELDLVSVQERARCKGNIDIKPLHFEIGAHG